MSEGPPHGNLLSSSFRMLSDAQLRQIHDASLEILARTGVRVPLITGSPLSTFACRSI